MVFVVDEDAAMAECIARACAVEDVWIFSNGIDAISATNEVVPDLVFLEVLLLGPDGFAFLNEMASYSETAEVPIVIVSTIDFQGKDLSAYNVVGVLNKATMRPEEVAEYVRKYC